MRFFAPLAAAAIAVAACGGTAANASPSPTVATTAPTASPSPTPSNVFKAELKTSNEVPPITDAEASCSGTGRLPRASTAPS